MGRSKGGKAQANQRTTASDAAASDADDALLDQAIADNRAAASSKAELSAPPKAALSQHDIIEKMNTVPTFCLLNGEQNIVGMQDETGAESCTWFTEADDAREMFAFAKQQNEGVPLHLGVTPLGLAFALAEGWADSLFVGNMRLQGKHAIVTQLAPMLAQQCEAQGVPPATWHLPVFCCDELSSPTVMPVFMSRSDLVAAWVASGRTKESVPEHLTVLDLRVLVHQMQTDTFAWSTLEFVGSPRSVQLVREAKLSSARLRMGAPPPLPADEPPPLHCDEPPPLT
jgi:hypothetical protein